MFPLLGTMVNRAVVRERVRLRHRTIYRALPARTQKVFWVNSSARRVVGRENQSPLRSAPVPQPPPAPGWTPPHAGSGSAMRPANLRSCRSLHTRPAATGRCARRPRPASTIPPASSPEMPLRAPYHGVRECAGFRQSGDGVVGGRLRNTTLAAQLGSVPAVFLRPTA